MCQRCMISGTNIISGCTFLEKSASLQKLTNEAVFQASHILFK